MARTLRLFVVTAFFLASLGLPVLAQQGAPQPPAPPSVAAVPKTLEIHGHARIDNYFWLKERDNPQVKAYLEAENAYTDAMLAHTQPLQEALYQEIIARIAKDDNSVPYRKGDYWYYRVYRGESEYPIHCRRKGTMEAPEEVMLDVNQLATGHEFYSVSWLSISPKQDILAFGADAVGRRIYTLRFKDLATGKMLDDVLENVTGQHAWAEDNKTVFYTKQDPESLRWNRIYRHVLGTDPAKDVLIYEETDETFNTLVFKTTSQKFLVIHSFHTLTDEARILPADQPEGEWKMFQPRQRGREYKLDHFGDKFYVRTNENALNFRLMETPEAATGVENWKEIVAHDPEVLLEGFELFRDHLVLVQRKEGLARLRIRRWDGSGEHDLAFDDPSYVAIPDANEDPNTPLLRFWYTSLIIPGSVYDYDMNTRQKTLLKRDPVLGGFDPANYVSDRVWAPSRDGKKIPVSLAYRKDLRKATTGNPLLLDAYGAYGLPEDPYFDSSYLSLMDRGFIYGIAHVRGGNELGRAWYDDGKHMNKKNTFNDFIDASEFLLQNGFAEKGKLFAWGGSAGGLLMGVVANWRPDLYQGIANFVPYVDGVTSMLDPDIPLTTSEYDEWGNPNEKPAYDYMLSYSPYDNLEAKSYPNLLVLTSFQDSQVQYWESAKYVAKLRTLKTGPNLLLLKTNMDAGHGGASGRFKRQRDYALVFAFFLNLIGIEK